MREICYDNQSGRLERDRIWQLAMPEVDEGWVYGETAKSAVEYIKSCALNSEHFHDISWKDLQIDLLGGSRNGLGDSLLVWDAGAVLVTVDFAERLRQSALTGYSLEAVVRIAVNQTTVANPVLLLLNAPNTGRDGRWKVVGENECPFCRNEPIICPACGDWNRVCPGCGKRTFGEKEGFKVREWPDMYVVDQALFRGANLIKHGGIFFVDSVCKRWMEESNFHPVIFKPAFANVA